MVRWAVARGGQRGGAAQTWECGAGTLLYLTGSGHMTLSICMSKLTELYAKKGVDFVGCEQSPSEPAFQKHQLEGLPWPPLRCKRNDKNGLYVTR